MTKRCSCSERGENCYNFQCFTTSRLLFFSFLFNATHNPDFQADPEDAPDACSHPEMTLPTPMTPFIEHDLSPPTRVDAWALTACSPERRGGGGKRKEKKKGVWRCKKENQQGTTTFGPHGTRLRGGNLFAALHLNIRNQVTRKTQQWGFVMCVSGLDVG